MGVRQKENLDINTAQIYTDEIKPLNVTLQSVKSVNILLFFLKNDTFWSNQSFFRYKCNDCHILNFQGC